MTKKKLLSIVLAALLAIDVVCFSLTYTYHAASCDSNASVTMEEIDAPTGNFSEEIIIIDPAYDSYSYIDKDGNRQPIEEWLYVPQVKPAAVAGFGDNQVGTPMVFENLFPGDSGDTEPELRKTYTITVAHQYQVALHFNVVMQDDPSYEKLAEVLMMKITVNGTQVYDGLIDGFEGNILGFDKNFSAVQNETAEYTIEVYLPTSVGNEYMNKTLKCDYVWTLYEEKEDVPPIIIPIPPDEDETTATTPDETDPPVSVEEPVEGLFEWEEFDYIPEPCYFKPMAIIMGALFAVLALGLILVRRKERNHD